MWWPLKVNSTSGIWTFDRWPRFIDVLLWDQFSSSSVFTYTRVYRCDFIRHNIFKLVQYDDQCVWQYFVSLCLWSVDICIFILWWSFRKFTWVTLNEVFEIFDISNNSGFIRNRSDLFHFTSFIWCDKLLVSLSSWIHLDSLVCSIEYCSFRLIGTHSDIEKNVNQNSQFYSGQFL